MAERDDIEEVMKARRIANRMALEAAAKGDPLAGMLVALEKAAEPFFLGVDEDGDDSDLAVFP